MISQCFIQFRHLFDSLDPHSIVRFHFHIPILRCNRLKRCGCACWIMRISRLICVLFRHDDPRIVCAVHTHQHDFLFVYRDQSGNSTFIDAFCSLYLSSPLLVQQDSDAVFFKNFPAHINMCPCFNPHISAFSRLHVLHSRRASNVHPSTSSANSSILQSISVILHCLNYCEGHVLIRISSCQFLFLSCCCFFCFVLRFFCVLLLCHYRHPFLFALVSCRLCCCSSPPAVAAVVGCKRSFRR